MSLQTLFAIFLIFLVFNAGSAFAQTDEIRYQIITDVNCQSRTTSAIADDVVEEYFALSKIKHIASPLECGARDVKIDENLQSNDLIILIMEDPTFVLSSDDLSLIDNHGNTKYYEKGKKHILFVRSNPLDDHSTFFDLSHALSHFVSKINNQPDSISIDMANRIFHELNSCKKDLYPFYNQFKDCPQDMYSILQIMSISYGDNMYVAETPHPESAKINNDTESIMQTSSNELERYLPDVNNIKITKNMDDIIEFSYESGISHIGGSITKYETIEQENSNFAAAVVLSDLKVDYNRYDKVDCASGKILSKNVLVCKKDRYHIVMRTDEDIDLEQPMVQMLGKLGANHRNTGAYDKTPTISKGGCLIATAAYGTEMSSQVQLLREIRDNVLFGTDSGTTFMVSFDQFYYTFSPGVADLERQSPIFKEIVKIAITPMLSTLSILNYVNIDSEYEMLGFGIGIIILNAGMYLVIPAIIIVKLRQKLCR